jgi:3-phenylpropionate/cinnamic acid dioxygenase small subunit
MRDNQPVQSTPVDQELHDRIALADVLVRFARAIDSRDWETYRLQFAASVEIDYRSLLGGDVLVVSAENWAKQASRAFAGFQTTQHYISNQVSVIAGDRGVCDAYLCAEHFAQAKDDLEFWTLGGTYQAQFQRTEAGWKINALCLTVLWSRGNPNIFEIAAGNVPNDGHL